MVQISRIKNRKHMNTSEDPEKAFDKIQHASQQKLSINSIQKECT
jgi:nitrogen regulatory protein PII-like uncharacterized protein